MKLITKEAILYVLALRNGPPSKYALAKAMRLKSPIMIDHYLNGTRMKKDTAEEFERTFGITITDIYDPTADAMERHKNDTKDISRGGER